MKYKIFLFIIGVCSILQGCNNVPTSYELNGEVYDSRFNEKFIYLSKVEGNELTNIDSSLVKDNKFFLKGVQDEPTICYLRFKRNEVLPEYMPVIFILENGTFSIQIKKSDSKAVGTELNHSLLSFRTTMEKYDKDLSLIEKQYEKMIADSTINEEKEQQLYNEYNSVEKSQLEYVKKIIGKNLDNVFGAYVFNLNRNRLSDYDLKNILQKAGSIFKKQPDVKLISERLARLEETSVGRMYKDFDTQNIQGEKKSLSEYAGHGKFLIVGFWSSISSSSQVEMKKLIDIYKEYKYKGVDIVAISLDTDSLSWVRSIEQNHLACLQLSDLKGWTSEAATIYEINRIPYILLLNPDGSIAVRETNSEHLKKKLKELIN